MINDGAEWWTSVADPTVKGTFEGPASAVIQVTAGSGDAVTATLQGNTWSAKLAAGSITPAGVQLKVVMTGSASDPIEW